MEKIMNELGHVTYFSLKMLVGFAGAYALVYGIFRLIVLIPIGQ